jgi:hypothetical protein
MRLFSPAFEDGQPMPTRHTLEGGNISPELHWEQLPTGAKQLVLIVDDPNAPRELPFVHWVIYEIPGDTNTLREWLPKEPVLHESPFARQGRNDFGRIGYDGPRPPRGTGVHHYRFELFALDRPLQLEARLDHTAVRAAMAGKILGRCLLVGTAVNPDEKTAHAENRRF